MTDEVINMFGHVWWQGVISTPDFVSLFLSCIFYLWRKSKNVLWNEIKDLTLSLLISPSLPFLKIILCEGPNIFDIHAERTWEGLEICGVFMDSTIFKQQIYRSFLQMGGRCGGGVKKLVIFFVDVIIVLSLMLRK